MSEATRLHIAALACSLRDCIWFVQHTIVTRAGAWTAESTQQRQKLSFEGLYRWLEVQHARGESRNLYDPSTRQLLHRHKLPFKAYMVGRSTAEERALQVAPGSQATL